MGSEPRGDDPFGPAEMDAKTAANDVVAGRSASVNVSTGLSVIAGDWKKKKPLMSKMPGPEDKTQVNHTKDPDKEEDEKRQPTPKEEPDKKELKDTETPDLPDTQEKDDSDIKQIPDVDGTDLKEPEEKKKDDPEPDLGTPKQNKEDKEEDPLLSILNHIKKDEDDQGPKVPEDELLKNKLEEKKQDEGLDFLHDQMDKDKKPEPPSTSRRKNDSPGDLIKSGIKSYFGIDNLQQSWKGKDEEGKKLSTWQRVKKGGLGMFDLATSIPGAGTLLKGAGKGLKWGAKGLKALTKSSKVGSKVIGKLNNVLKTGKKTISNLNPMTRLKKTRGNSKLVRDLEKKNPGSTFLQKPTSSTKSDILKKARKRKGRLGKEKRLKDLATDTKVSSSDRGWINNELRRKKTAKNADPTKYGKHKKSGKHKYENRGKYKGKKEWRKQRLKEKQVKGPVKHPSIRNPPGKELRHRYGKDAKKGFGYKHSDLQDKGPHLRQTRIHKTKRGTNETKLPMPGY